MQQDSYDDVDGMAGTPSGFARVKSIISTAIGAIVAMSLLMALGIWFYRLGVRDAQNVPIIRAAAEPAKERPEDPGGLEAPHQDIESYQVASDRPASAAAVVIAPKPPEPSREDEPLGQIAAVEPPAPQEPAVAAELPAEPIKPGLELAATGQDAEETQVALAPVAEQPQTVSDETEPQSAVLGGTKYAPSASPSAPRRPANLVQRTAAAADQDVQRADDLARSAAKSRVQIQLAANPDRNAVRTMWNRIRSTNEDILRGRALAIQTTVSGGTTYYRLRVGPFKDAAEARNVCQALKARGQDCIVARNG